MKPLAAILHAQQASSSFEAQKFFMLGAGAAARHDGRRHFASQDEELSQITPA